LKCSPGKAFSGSIKIDHTGAILKAGTEEKQRNDPLLKT